MSAIRRREFLAAGFALAATPLKAADTVRFSITGAMEQGSLAFGSAPPGSLAALDGRPLTITPDGHFVFGFGYDQTKPSLVTVRYPDSGGDSRSFKPKARQYEIQRVNGLPQNTVTPPPEVEARINQEAENIYLARLTQSAGMDFLSGFDWPAPGILSGTFGSQRIDNGVPMAPHFGVDMAAPVGTPIHAPASGTVLISDDYYLDGGFTLIDHGQGVSTSYLHQSKRMVKVGDTVKRGQLMGLIGQTGRATGPHLHWAMNWFQVRLDPSRSARKPKPDPL
ncbi:MAG TPA: M23 family metallopeptidase [Rhizomicrobium sp.]|jgi:murein DD-endopeptidase MepM/ murein hydrolase activator NlpD|nr:M23 family metallopeptidase [Rhizomicrobium sp.]